MRLTIFLLNKSKLKISDKIMYQLQGVVLFMCALFVMKWAEFCELISLIGIAIAINWWWLQWVMNIYTHVHTHMMQTHIHLCPYTLILHALTHPPPCTAWWDSITDKGCKWTWHESEPSPLGLGVNYIPCVLFLVTFLNIAVTSNSW